MIYHGDHCLSDLADEVRETVIALRNLPVKFNSIVVQGLSGVLVGSPVSIELRLPLVIARKRSEMMDSHAFARVENAEALGNRWLFLDDFVSTGKTLNRVRDAIKYETQFRETVSVYAGAYLYADRYYARATEFEPGFDRSQYTGLPATWGRFNETIQAGEM